MNSTIRKSNMEAMRIFSMLMVLICHCGFPNGLPDSATCLGNPIKNFILILIDGLSVVCVNCFILISGYFGIRCTLKGIFNFIFIVLFYGFFIWLTVDIGIEGNNWLNIKSLVFSIKDFWFIWAYLGLYILSPVLNSFIEKASKKEFLSVIGPFFLLAFLGCLTTLTGLDIESGYNTILFIGIYLLGAGYHKFYLSEKWITWKKGLALYLGVTLISSLIFFLACTLLSSIRLRLCFYFIFTNYSSIFVVLASLGVLIFFSKVNFQNKIINWIGASAFSVYLIHMNVAVKPYYISVAKYLYDNNTPISWVLSVLIFTILVFLVCVLIDQIRKYLWNRISKLLFENRKILVRI